MNKNSSEILLSVVIISKNEEKNIANCIESVQRAAEEIEKSEVILVDSASTDKTIEIARQYPIKIIRLEPLVPLSPSAGRYVGFLNSCGKYVQFIDGDMTLNDGWFMVSLKVLRRDDKIAGMAGLLLENNSNIAKKQENNNIFKYPILEYEDVLFGGALYTRTALEKVGSYNPYLYGDEEAELCYRLRDAGYKLVKIPYDMVMHHRRDLNMKKEFKVRLFRKYYFGCGQTLRYSINKPKLFLAHLYRLWIYILNILWLFIGFVSLSISIIHGEYIYPVMWLVGTLSFSVTQLARKKSLNKLFLSLVSWNLFSLGIVLGFLRSPKNPETYPKKFRYIK